MNSSQSMIVVKDLWKRYKELNVLRGISLEVKPSEVMALIGPSGSGKSTLLKCINYLEGHDSGEIFVDGEPVGHTEQEGRDKPWSSIQASNFRAKIGMVFQEFNLFLHKTVVENVILAPCKVNKLSRKEAITLAEDLLNSVGLSEHRNKYPFQLSGGQQQRVAIARALAMVPKVMLFDEVTSALDPELSREVLQVMKNLASGGMTMMVVTHEMEFAREVADTVVFMEEGQIVTKGTPKSIFENQELDRVRGFLNKP